MAKKNNAPDTNLTEIRRNDEFVVGTPPTENKAMTPHRAVKKVSVRRTLDRSDVTILRVPHEKRAPLPIATILTIAAITALALFMMMNFAEIEKINAGISDLEAQVTELKTEKNSLEAQLQKVTNLTEIEEYAREVLGMEQPTKKFPVSLRPEDKTDIMEYKDEDAPELTTVFSGFGELFKSFFARD